MRLSTRRRLSNTNKFLPRLPKGNEMKADTSAQADDEQAFAPAAQLGAHPVASLHQLHPKQNQAAAAKVPAPAPAAAPEPARFARPRWIRTLARRRLEGVLGLTSLLMMIVFWYLLT